MVETLKTGVTGRDFHKWQAVFFYKKFAKLDRL
ncbi:hypothetical protein MHA_0942 [Mannheimia haemolytica PHL213]|nr:hypothetical protein MHA_0942 [Mannheimia haemolytica PHL213]